MFTKGRFAIQVAATCVVLAGCSTSPRERIIVKEIRIPVAVACTPTIPEKPLYAADAVSLDASLFDLVRALLIDREERRAREAVLDAALKGCSG